MTNLKLVDLSVTENTETNIGFQHITSKTECSELNWTDLTRKFVSPYEEQVRSVSSNNFLWLLRVVC